MAKSKKPAPKKAVAKRPAPKKPAPKRAAPKRPKPAAPASPEPVHAEPVDQLPGYVLVAGMSASDIRLVSQPVSSEQFLRTVGDNGRVRVAAPFPVAKLIGCHGIDGLNDVADEAVLPPGTAAALADIVYRVVGLSSDGVNILMEVNADASEVVAELRGGRPATPTADAAYDPREGTFSLSEVVDAT